MLMKGNGGNVPKMGRESLQNCGHESIFFLIFVSSY